ncbi:hypothetical protein [Mammaliicoccus sp. O-M53]|uniref:hypothetical protein n=1 Tax=Mammaliicoccus sp. O-M53 TaxID=2898712 RepID=UPI001EFBE0C3|nr:hypothetical protein [Mammaliicoccus sp. O-M53]
MIISNTINDFFNNFHLTDTSLKTYYAKYRSEFQHAEENLIFLEDDISTTLSKLETDTAQILKINTKLVHIIFEVRLQILKQFNTYLRPDIYFLIGAYRKDGFLKIEDTPHIYFFIESLCEHNDDLYDIIAYYFTKLLLRQLNSTSENSILEEAVTSHIMNKLNYTYPYTNNNKYKAIQNLETKLNEQLQTDSIIKLFTENEHSEILKRYS